MRLSNKTRSFDLPTSHLLNTMDNQVFDKISKNHLRKCYYMPTEEIEDFLNIITGSIKNAVSEDMHSRRRHTRTTYYDF